MISIICGENQVSSSDFTQANFELIYDRIQNAYIKRFNAQMPVDQSGGVYTFINDNTNNLLTVTDNADLTLDHCKVIFVYSDVINNICRIELQQQNT